MNPETVTAGRSAATASTSALRGNPRSSVQYSRSPTAAVGGAASGVPAGRFELDRRPGLLLIQFHHRGPRRARPVADRQGGPHPRLRRAAEPLVQYLIQPGQRDRLQVPRVVLPFGGHPLAEFREQRPIGFPAGEPRFPRRLAADGQQGDREQGERQNGGRERTGGSHRAAGERRGGGRDEPGKTGRGIGVYARGARAGADRLPHRTTRECHPRPCPVATVRPMREGAVADGWCSGRVAGVGPRTASPCSRRTTGGFTPPGPPPAVRPGGIPRPGAARRGRPGRTNERIASVLRADPGHPAPADSTKTYRTQAGRRDVGRRDRGCPRPGRAGAWSGSSDRGEGPACRSRRPRHPAEAGRPVSPN